MSQETDGIILNSIEEWNSALELFSRSTGLMISMYLPTGQRVCGPFGFTPLSKILLDSGKFEENQICHYTEQRELLKIRINGKTTFDFLKTLRIDGIPLIFNDQIVAVVMMGWVFDHFPDPIECDRLAREIGVAPNHLWQIARLQSPMSSEKFGVYEDMMMMLTSSLAKQLHANAKLKEAAKTKDELLAIVSHELKTPLTSLLLRIQMLRSHRVDTERMDKFLASMETNARLEAKLIDDLLDAARMVTGKYAFEPGMINLSDVLKTVHEMMSDAAKEKDIVLSLEGVATESPFVGDSVRLSQAFMNLISNSIKFTPPNGNIKLSLVSKISSYEVYISDDGKGIDKNFLPEMFQLFSQERQALGIHSGLGLGLALVKNIIDLHRGKIEVQSLGENKGTRFEISLPRDGFLSDG